VLGCEDGNVHRHFGVLGHSNCGTALLLLMCTSDV
jgi:hypothetical protein